MKRSLERSAGRGLEEFLEQSEDTYDLAVAADVFVYIGDLAPVFEALDKRLAPGAYFVFSAGSRSVISSVNGFLTMCYGEKR